MNNANKSMMLAFIGLLLANGALAQSTTEEKRSSGRDTAVIQRDASKTNTKEWERTHRASKIIGTDVHDMKGEKIGSVRDIVIDPKTGDISYAVVSFGGVMGVGSKYFAVPWKSMRPTEDAEKFALNVDREALKSAPGFDKDRWPNMADKNWASDVESYWQGRQSTGASEAAGGKSGAGESERPSR